jgi:hypothetical protein
MSSSKTYLVQSISFIQYVGDVAKNKDNVAVSRVPGIKMGRTGK